MSDMDWIDWMVVAFLVITALSFLGELTGGGNYRDMHPTVMFW